MFTGAGTRPCWHRCPSCRSVSPCDSASSSAHHTSFSSCTAWTDAQKHRRLLLTNFHSYRASKNCCDKVILPRQARYKQTKDDTLRQDRLGTPKKGCWFLHLVFPTRQCANSKHRRDAVRVGKAELAARPRIGHIIHLLNVIACRTPVLVFVVRFPCVFPEPVLVK